MTEKLWNLHLEGLHSFAQYSHSLLITYCQVKAGLDNLKILSYLTNVSVVLWLVLKCKTMKSMLIGGPDSGT